MFTAKQMSDSSVIFVNICHATSINILPILTPIQSALCILEIHYHMVISLDVYAVNIYECVVQ